MATYLGNHAGNTNSVTEEYPVADGVTVTDGDFVYLDDGRVTNASITGKALLGTVVGGDSRKLDRNYSRTATGDEDGLATVLVRIEEEARYAVVASAEVEAEHEGQKFNLTGNTGEQEVNVASAGENGQLVCVRVGEGVHGNDEESGVFRIAAHQLRNDSDTTD